VLTLPDVKKFRFEVGGGDGYQDRMRRARYA
jgi:hypothetical protein